MLPHLETWQIVLAVLFFVVGLVILIVWQMNHIKHLINDVDEELDNERGDLGI